MDKKWLFCVLQNHKIVTLYSWVTVEKRLAF